MSASSCKRYSPSEEVYVFRTFSKQALQLRQEEEAKNFINFFHLLPNIWGEYVIGSPQKGNVLLAEELLELMYQNSENCSKVTVLDLSECDLTGLPPEIKLFHNLEVLDICGNPLKSLPDEIGNLVQLEELEAAGCELEKMPDSIGSLNNLKILNVHDNQLQMLPDSIMNLKGKLEELYIFGNPCNQRYYAQFFKVVSAG